MCCSKNFRLGRKNGAQREIYDLQSTGIRIRRASGIVLCAMLSPAGGAAAEPDGVSMRSDARPRNRPSASRSLPTRLRRERTAPRDSRRLHLQKTEVMRGVGRVKTVERLRRQRPESGVRMESVAMPFVAFEAAF